MAQVTEELEAQKVIDNIVRRLEEYHVNGNWDEFFDNDVLDVLLLTTPDKEDVLGFSILLSYGGPTIEFLCDRGDGKIIYSYGDVEVKRDVDPKVCDDIIDFLDETTS